MINYQIYSFNKDLGSISVQYKNGEQVVATYNVDIPLTDAGLFITGEELNSYLLAMYPQHVIDRQNKLTAGVANVADIESLIVPLEGIEPFTNAELTEQEQANRKMWVELEEQKRIAKILVKLGVLDADPTVIPVASL
jgi:hypothetical protein